MNFTKIVRPLEVIAGIGTAAVAVVVTAVTTCPRFANDYIGIAIYVGLTLVVAAGACLHAVKTKNAGFILLLIGGILVAFISGGIALVGGLFLFCGVNEALLILTPSALAIVAILASLINWFGRQRT